MTQIFITFVVSILLCHHGHSNLLNVIPSERAAQIGTFTVPSGGDSFAV